MSSTNGKKRRFRIEKLEERIAPTMCCNPCGCAGGGTHQGNSHAGSHKGSHQGSLFPFSGQHQVGKGIPVSLGAQQGSRGQRDGRGDRLGTEQGLGFSPAGRVKDVAHLITPM